MATELVMPEMGEGVIEGTIAKWLKQVGDSIAQYEPVLEVETDKVTTEITAETAGTLLQILAPEGETVAVGVPLALIGEAGETPAEAPAIKREAAAEAAVAEAAAAETAVAQPATDSVKAPSANGSAEKKGSYTGRISPVVGRIANEHNVDLSQVEGTGLDGRITKKDILAHVEKRDKAADAAATTAATPPPTFKAEPSPAKPAAGPTPAAAAASPAAGEIMPLSSMRRAIAEHMVRSKQTSPHVTTVFEFDFTAAARHRAAHKASFARDGANLTFTAYIVAGTVTALKEHRLVNSSWSDNGVVLKQAINVGLATAIEEGLIVPVIKNADGLSLLGVARAINDLADRARRKQLRPDEVQDGTFTITNHGVSGSLFANPIINQPQCAILSVGMIEKRVKVINDAIAIRPMAYVGLTFDHRILDGASADGFMSYLKRAIENWPE
jgi:pyruvate/2-oxoglutarate dehydrogenase complex dihydrolipoamide acyltransferase (E2) component